MAWLALQVSSNFGLNPLKTLFECPLYPLDSTSNIFDEASASSTVTIQFSEKSIHSRPVDDTHLPKLKDSLKHWESQPVNLDAVMGGEGNGKYSKSDIFASKRFLRSLIPNLDYTFYSPSPSVLSQRVRALDLCAGIGRVSSELLLHYVHDVVLVEPVNSLMNEAWARASASTDPDSDWEHNSWPGMYDGSKSATFLRGTMQDIHPARPLLHNEWIGRTGYGSEEADTLIEDMDTGFDIIWVQWCCCYLSDHELVDFLRRSQEGLRREGMWDGQSYLVIKDNTYAALPGGPPSYFKEGESCLIRSDATWKKIFREAGFTIAKQVVQPGLPKHLMQVKMYALH